MPDPRLNITDVYPPLMSSILISQADLKRTFESHEAVLDALQRAGANKDEQTKDVALVDALGLSAFILIDAQRRQYSALTHRKNLELLVERFPNIIATEQSSKKFSPSYYDS
ncbi:hypothetical protein BGZ76_004320 [Entomortierella beljakovae]|nr:hypothetical protein BGZ76_004320 [Entomortierella beljakovae]